MWVLHEENVWQYHHMILLFALLLLLLPAAFFFRSNLVLFELLSVSLLKASEVAAL